MLRPKGILTLAKTSSQKNVLNAETSSMNESIESGGYILHPARRITVAIGTDPDLWLFLENLRADSIMIYTYQYFRL